jgi:hypothetical protein
MERESWAVGKEVVRLTSMDECIHVWLHVNWECCKWI